MLQGDIWVGSFFLCFLRIFASFLFWVVFGFFRFFLVHGVAVGLM